jgi:hypothetical protein
MRVKGVFRAVMIGASVVAAFVVSPGVVAGELEDLTDQVLRADSQRWFFNRYVPGSTRNARFLSRSRAQKSAVVYSEYTLNGNQTGWVKIKIENGNLECLEFFDFPGRCRALGDTPSSRFLSRAFSDMGGTSRGCSTDDMAYLNRGGLDTSGDVRARCR